MVWSCTHTRSRPIVHGRSSYTFLGGGSGSGSSAQTDHRSEGDWMMVSLIPGRFVKSRNSLAIKRVSRSDMIDFGTHDRQR